MVNVASHLELITSTIAAVKHCVIFKIDAQEYTFIYISITVLRNVLYTTPQASPLIHVVYK